MNDIIKRARNSHDAIFSLSIILIGILSCLMAESSAITFMGIFFIITGIVCWFILKSGYCDKNTQKRLKKKEVYFAIDHKAALLDAIMNNPEQLSKFPQSNMNTMKLNLYFNDDDIYMQLFEYIPCDYKPCTKLIRHEVFDLSKLVR